MTRISINTTCRLAAGMLMGLAAVAQVSAEDFGVARISDRPKTVVRAQSPELTLAPPAELQAVPAIQLTDAEEPDDDDLEECHKPGPVSYPQGAGQVISSYTTSEGITPGLHYSVSCPEHGGVYHDGCSKCRYFAGFGDGNWSLDQGGNAVWCEQPYTNMGDKFLQCFHGLGDKFCAKLRHCDKCLAKRCCNGEGQPLLGHYKIVYPVNPWHFDGRDGQAFAAAEYGGPVSVPLAPVVYQQYNYGWGIPSSRLTPISRPLPLGGRP